MFLFAFLIFDGGEISFLLFLLSSPVLISCLFLFFLLPPFPSSYSISIHFSVSPTVIPASSSSFSPFSFSFLFLPSSLSSFYFFSGFSICEFPFLSPLLPLPSSSPLSCWLHLFLPSFLSGHTVSWLEVQTYYAVGGRSIRPQPTWTPLSVVCLASSCVVLAQRASSCVLLPHLASSSVVLPRLASPCLILPRLPSPFLTLLHVALSYLVSLRLAALTYLPPPRVALRFTFSLFAGLMASARRTYLWSACLLIFYVSDPLFFPLWLLIYAFFRIFIYPTLLLILSALARLLIFHSYSLF